MAQTPQPEETGGAGETGRGTGWPPGLFGSSTTILLLVFAVAVFWWSRRRRVQMEEQLREQRREAEATAERSALDVAHLMRTAPRPGVAAAANEGPGSGAQLRSADTAKPSAAVTIDDATNIPAAAPDHERAPVTSDQEEVLAREIDRAEARAAVERAAEEQLERASQSAQSGGESLVRRAAAAQDAAEEAAADNADVERLGLGLDVPGAIDAIRRDVAESPEVMREPRLDVGIPAGAVAGDGTAICPPDYPIKGNRQSRIFHRPGQVSYTSTVAEYCFASEAAAESAGYRPSRARGQRGQPD
ncbi:MAG TPA: hypothetical protein VHG52_14175 [Thermomicrobiales bacterium]|nr:hypothetical protein [Thermomicrobiales bacterium]